MAKPLREIVPLTEYINYLGKDYSSRFDAAARAAGISPTRVHKRETDALAELPRARVRDEKEARKKRNIQAMKSWKRNQ